MRPIFVDTSGWCAIYDRGDSNHRQALAYWQELSKNLGLLYTSEYVLDETLTLLRLKVGHLAAVQFGDTVLGSEAVDLVSITKERWHRAWELFKQCHDQTFSFTDCTSFILMKELGLTEVLAFDHHFRQMGFITRPI
ncbi:MAG: type II toxin-antitoxin system VapC family toxin [Clostridia bacterium]|nr:type II toxin-antitoxin system VapC family toxin [Clostridia bacterium]